MSKSIFISHSHKDRKIVTPLVNFLRQAGIKVWDAEAEIKSGDSLIGKIQTAVERFDYLGVVLTKNSCSSNWVLKEVYSALNEEINSKTIKVIPILAESCDIPYFLQEKLYADIRGDKFTLGVEKIIETLTYEDKDKYIKRFYPFIFSHPKGKRVIEQIEELFRHKDFPKKMFVNDELLTNPIYSYISNDSLDKITIDYSPKGKEIFRLMPLDIHLIKAKDIEGQPFLLNYYSGMFLSGWQTWLFPHRGTDKNINLKERLKEHQFDLETLLRLNINSTKISYSNKNDYILSFKPDFGYGGFVLYIYFICNVKIKSTSEIVQLKEFSVTKGSYERKFKWFSIEEFLDNEEILSKNADLIKGLHLLYETSLIKIPNSITERIK